jgi:hypothetical protein
MVTVTDDGGGSTGAIQATVNVADAALSSPVGATIAATEGQAFAPTAIAGFADLNPGNNAADMTASIAWGDGTTSPGIVTFNSGDSTYTVTAGHSYAEAGKHSPNVTVTDDDGSTTSVPATVNVADAPLTATGTTVAATEGQAFASTTPIATFTDANPGNNSADMTASIDWGDGTTSPGTVAANPAGGFTVSAAHTYAEDGTRTATVTIADAGAKAATASATVNVSDAPLAAMGASGLAATEGAPSGTLTLATFTDADPNGTQADYTATIAWGDGTTSPGTVAPNATGGFSVSGAHAYGEEGAPAATVTIADAGGKTTTATPTINVADAPLTLQTFGVAGAARSQIGGAIASLTDASPSAAASDYSATVNWGDGTSGPAVVAADPSGGFSVSGSHSYAHGGAYIIVVTVHDDGGKSISGKNRVSVTATLPRLTPTMTWAFQHFARYTIVRSLIVDGVPAGAKVNVSCKGGGCPFASHTAAVSKPPACKRKHCRPKTRTVDLSRLFRGRHLAAGAHVTVGIVQANTIGKVYIFTFRAGQDPNIRITCLAPGSTVPGRGC